MTMAAAVCGALCVPSLASAAVTIGGDVAAPGSPQPCDNVGCEFVQLSLVGARTAAPFDGVVVRWRVSGSSGPLALRVMRAAGSSYVFISTSALRTPASTDVESFATRQPIRAGDYVGVEGENTTAQLGFASPGTAGDVAAAWASVVPDGFGTPPNLFANGDSFAYNADVEPDADHDGYGDETQDKCPSDASTQGVCPRPAPPADTTAAASAPAADKTPAALSTSARSARLSKAGSISFLVTANENATGRATGTIRVPERAKPVPLAGRNVSLSAGRPAKVTLRLSKRNAALVRRGLAKRQKLEAVIALSVKDSAGNPSATTLSLRLER